jgi:hypothetical protein
MVHERDAYDGPSFDKSFSEDFVGFGGGGIATGMVVDDDDAVGTDAEGFAEDFTRMGGGLVESALKDNRSLDQFEADIEIDGHELFGPGHFKSGIECFENDLGAIKGGSNGGFLGWIVGLLASSEFEGSKDSGGCSRVKFALGDELVGGGFLEIFQSSEMGDEVLGHADGGSLCCPASDKDSEKFFGADGDTREKFFPGAFFLGEVFNAAVGCVGGILGCRVRGLRLGRRISGVMTPGLDGTVWAVGVVCFAGGGRWDAQFLGPGVRLARKPAKDQEENRLGAAATIGPFGEESANLVGWRGCGAIEDAPSLKDTSDGFMGKACRMA